MVTDSIVLGPEFDLLPDDTEELLMGSSIHQDAIVAAVGSLRRYAKRAGLPWHVANQLPLIIPRGGGKRPFQPSPDVAVHTTLTGAPLSSLRVANAGPPALVIEVASPATAREHDLDTLSMGAKPQIYAASGIAEYLVFDPAGDFVPEQLRAWRAGPDGRYVDWEPDANGRWISALGVSFAPVGVLLRVYDAAGQVVPSGEDMDDLLAESKREVAALQAEVRRLRGE